MRRNSKYGSSRLPIVVGLCLVVGISIAVGGQKPGHTPGGGGGGTEQPPAGVIYFRHNDGVDDYVWSMNADGTNLVELPNAPLGHPSHFVHDGERWFVSTDWTVDSANQPVTFPDAQALSHVSVSSETGLSAPLVVEEDLAILANARWLPDDNSVSFIAERWTFDAEGLPMVTEAGLYVVDVGFDANGAVTGAVPGSLKLLVPLENELRVNENGFPTRGDEPAANAAGHSWHPNQSEFVFGIQLDWPDGFPQGTRVQEIWIVDLLADPQNAVTLLDGGDGVGGPEWSPDGRHIGCISWSGTVVYDLLKGGAKTLRDTNRYGWGLTLWSPTGEHFVTYRWNKDITDYDGIFRYTDELNGKTELLGKTCESCYEFPLGWR